ncbi:MAG TPA: hypothetical protein VKG26_11800 [Bacteroidia bacterium]|nr:hypothetical protein [Bacteroidia bacterium]
MKNFLLFILILVSKIIQACGFYPYGEDTRFSLFNPQLFGFHSYSDFYYSSNSFDTQPYEYTANNVEPNTKLWLEYCRGKVDTQSVYTAIYKLLESEIDEHSQNAMIQYLYKQKDSDALNYLRFAKNCEFFNSWEDDPWEKQTFSAMSKRTELMNKAINFAKTVRKQELKKRYTFLAIRLAWYNHHYDKVKTFFASEFEKTKKKDILYYWGLYFKSFTEEDTALANFELAQVFANAIDKRFVCHQYFKKKIPIEQVLKFGKTNEERANVYLLAGIEKYNKALSYIQTIYGLNPASDGLSFLLLREVNKIEDFVFTPYYTLFQPSLSYDYWSEENDPSVNSILNRSENDRIYAKEVLQFVNSVDLRKVNNPLFWKTCKAYLQFITRDYNSCLALVRQLEKSTLSVALSNQLQLIKALALTAMQSKGKSVIPTEIQSTLISNKKNGDFIFAIGKELEYLGNTTDAALLYSNLTQTWYEENTDYGNKMVFWKTLKSKGRYYSDYFTDYFDYTDAVYSPEQIQNLVDSVQINKNKKDPFLNFKYNVLKDQIPRLLDLLGTKYIRQNKLEKALATFEKVGNQYWNRVYTTWEDKANIFDQNPFFRLKYTPKFIAPADTIRLNKVTITKQLIYYLQKAENKNEKNRDYYYFLVANAYYNMGSNGNVWMMRRFGNWSDYNLSLIEDEVEFRQSNLAKEYYLLAKQYAQSDKFKALCLKMVVRCEENKIDYEYIADYNHANYDSLMAINKYYIDLKTNYPDYFNELASNCDKFESYFNSRRITSK